LNVAGRGLRILVLQLLRYDLSGGLPSGAGFASMLTHKYRSK